MLWPEVARAQTPFPHRLPAVDADAASIYSTNATPPNPVSGQVRIDSPWEGTRPIDTVFPVDVPVEWAPTFIPDSAEALFLQTHYQASESGASGSMPDPQLLTIDAADILRRLQRQEEELRELRRQMSERMPLPSGASPGRSAADATPFGTASSRAEASSWQDGTVAPEMKPADGWVDVSAEKWNVKLGGHVQMDYPLWAQHSEDIPAENYFEFRRLRLIADGTGYGVYDFRLQVDFEPEAGDNVATPVVDVKDAYFTANDVPVIQRWRIGNFFIPFGLEQVTNDTNNSFLERSIPTQNIFCGDREVGFATYGVSEKLNTTWTFGAFFDRISESRKERIDDRQGIRVSSRFTHLLYYDEPSKGRYLLHTGAGLFYTHFYDKMTRFRARPQIHEGPFLIDSGDIGAVDDLTGNVELAAVWGPFSVQNELYMCHVNLAGGQEAQLYGYYTHASYFLTGENRHYERYGQHGAQFGRNVPFSNFFMVPGCHGLGAWELKVRNSYLDLSQLNSGQYQDLTVGFNWYWSDRTRVMFEWIHPWTTAQTVFGTTQANILGMRFDFNW